MSELKARRAYFSEDDYERGTHKICAKVSDCGYDRKNDWWSYAFEDEVYIKSEADKVIADLEEKHKTEVKELLCLIRDKENNFNRAFDSEEKELRRHKYKRCLAMAEMCNARDDEEDAKVNGRGASCEYISKEMKYWERWRWRWLKIAEKFKEAK